MVYKKKFIFLWFAFIFMFMVGVSSSYSTVELDYNYFLVDKNSDTNKVSYMIRIKNDSINGLDFRLDIFYEDTFLKKCEEIINPEVGVVFTKIICEVPKAGDGHYIFDVKLSKDNDVLINDINNGFVYGSVTTEMSFKDLENDKTTIVINVEGNGTNLQVQQRIPKEVIPLLNNDNRNSLITSERDYIILEEDPLIAWNLDSAPAKINYTINKKIDLRDRENFGVEVSNQSSFNNVEWFIYVTIIIILVLIFIPFIKSKNKVKSKK